MGPAATLEEDDLMSARVSNYQYNPVFGALLLIQVSVESLVGVVA
jgi:hypothetical protein